MMEYFRRKSPRTKKMLIGSSSLAFSRVICALLGFVSTGIIARYLGGEEFGLWALVMSMPGLFAGFDLGFSNSLKNKLSVLYAQKNEKESQSYFFSIFYGFSILTLFLMITVFLFKPLIPWPWLFKTSLASIDKMGSFLFTANIFVILATIPFSLAYSAGFYSYQESHLNSLFTLLGPVITLLMLVVLVPLKASFVTITMMFIFTGLLIYVISFLVFLVKRHWTFIALNPAAMFQKIKELFSTSAQFVLIQVAAGIFFSIDPFIVSKTTGLAVAGDYYLIKKICTIAVITHLSSLGAVWPAYTEAAENKDLAWIKKVLKSVAIYTLIAFAVFIIFLYYLGNPFIHLWTGKMIKEPSWFVLLGIWALFYAWGNAFSVFLNAINNLKLQLLWSFLATVFIIPLSLWLAKLYGLPGVILAQLILMAPATIGNTIQTVLYIKKKSKVVSS